MADERTGFEDDKLGDFHAHTTLATEPFEARRGRIEQAGERRLVVAILEDAVECFQKYHRATSAEQRALFTDARRWIVSRSRAWFFSFENVCEAIGIDPSCLRARLLAWEASAGQESSSRTGKTSAEKSGAPEDVGGCSASADATRCSAPAEVSQRRRTA